MKCTAKEMAEMALKLRAGETIEIDGVRIRGKMNKNHHKTSCEVCKVKCTLIYPLAAICSLVDEIDSSTHEVQDAYYMETVNP